MAVKTHITYKDLSMDQIIAWCKQNNKVDWLKEEMKKEVEYKVYPKVKVKKLDAEGKPVLSKKGKPMYTTTVDKTAKAKIEMKPITFIQVKNDFVDTFMPQIKPKAKAKKPTMYEIVANL